jgi:DNA-binding CsgD family transcriptional regulator
MTVADVNTMPGFLLLSDELQPIAFNAEAVSILAFPMKPDRIQQKTAFLEEKIKYSLLDKKNDSKPDFVRSFKSGARQYICRAFHIDCKGQQVALCSTAVILERHSSSSSEINYLLRQFDLTPREMEAVALLVNGLTSKEIATRMNISPNTVKAFLRLVMLKMDVSTRSGIVGRIVGPRS